MTFAGIALYVLIAIILFLLAHDNDDFNNEEILVLATFWILTIPFIFLYKFIGGVKSLTERLK